MNELGRVVATGGAPTFGDAGAQPLNQPIVAMASTPSGNGYWLVATDGGIFAFGDARFFGSTGAIRLNQPIVGMAPTPSGNGYWLVARDGGIFAFGDAPFLGSAVAEQRVIRSSVSTKTGGYALLTDAGALVSFAPAIESSVTAPTAAVIAPTTVAPLVPSVVATTSTTTTSTTTRPTTTSTTRPPTTTTTTRPPTTTTTTRPPTTTTTSTIPASGNVFAGRSVWVDPYNPARSQASAWAVTRPGDAASMARLGDVGTGVWIGEWSGDVTSAVNAVSTAAAASQTVPVFVAYNIPGRDCGQWSAGGAARAADYQQWIRGFAAGIGNRRAAVVLEPDALAQLDCLDDASRSTRLALLNDAVDVLRANTGTAVYLDAGHPGWHDAPTMADRLRSAGADRARGFSLNVSNFDTTQQNVAFGDDIARRLGNAHYVVDTSRNGNGSNGEWCNPMGRALGSEPTTSTGSIYADAFLWIKRPGESDGACNGGPSAGAWWSDYALGLARSAGR